MSLAFNDLSEFVIIFTLFSDIWTSWKEGRLVLTGVRFSHWLEKDCARSLPELVKYPWNSLSCFSGSRSPFVFSSNCLLHLIFCLFNDMDEEVSSLLFLTVQWPFSIALQNYICQVPVSMHNLPLSSVLVSKSWSRVVPSFDWFWFWLFLWT